MKNKQDLSHFAEAQAIIKDLQQAITQKKQIRDDIFKLNPDGSSFLINIGCNKKLGVGCTAQQMLVKLKN